MQEELLSFQRHGNRAWTGAAYLFAKPFCQWTDFQVARAVKALAGLQGLLENRAGCLPSSWAVLAPLPLPIKDQGRKCFDFPSLQLLPCPPAGSLTVLALGDLGSWWR